MTEKFHVYKSDENHVFSEKCWCSPVLVEKTDSGHEVWVHNEMSITVGSL